MDGKDVRNIWSGKVHLECKGTQIPVLIDQVVKESIRIENVFWLDEHRINVVVYIRDFFRFIKWCRHHEIRAKIIKKQGVPFLWKEIKKRKMFGIGFVLFFILLLCMTSMIWRVEVEGTNARAIHDIRMQLQKQGVYFGQLKMRLPAPSLVQQELLAVFPELSWVGFRVEGTRIIVTVVEKKRAEIHKSEYPSYGPVHLISRKNALIIDVRAEKGNPLVDVNDMVKAGQILISGVYGDPTGESGPVVGARGAVLGEVWYESSVVVPMIQKRQVFTGARTSSRSIHIGNMIFHNPFRGSASFSHYKVFHRFHYLHVGNWKLPLGWVEEEYAESRYISRRLASSEATRLGTELCRKSVLQSISANGRIEEEKILQRIIKNDKVYLKVHFDAIENIAMPQPILRGEKPRGEND